MTVVVVVVERKSVAVVADRLRQLLKAPPVTVVVVVVEGESVAVVDDHCLPRVVVWYRGSGRQRLW